MESLSVATKFLPEEFDSFQYLLVAKFEVTNFFLAIQIQSRTVQVITEALIHRIICLVGPSKFLIVDKDSKFTQENIQFILQAVNCQLKIIIPFNHGNFTIKRQIKTVGKMTE